MPNKSHSNLPAVLNQAARLEVRRIDKELRAEVGPNPTEEQVLEAFARFFPGSHLTDKQVRQYARSVIAGRPHFV